jgi:hypothetical protein
MGLRFLLLSALFPLLPAALLGGHRFGEFRFRFRRRDWPHARKYVLHRRFEGLEHLPDALSRANTMEAVLADHGLELGQQAGLVFYERVAAIPAGQKVHPRLPMVEPPRVQHT